MKKLSCLLIFMICLLFLNGCRDKREIEDNIFAVLLGIDMAENKNITVTVAFPLTQTVGGGLDAATDNGSGNYSVMSVKAPTVAEGLNMIGAELSGPLALYSVKTIVISQEIAQSDMLRRIFLSWNFEKIRNTTNVLISGCKASEFIDARIKNAPIDPLRQEELLLEQANGSAHYRPIQLLELIGNLKSDSGDGVAMYGATAAKSERDNKQDDAEEKSSGDVIEGVKDGYLPTEIPIAAENESRISGLAVFRGTKMAGVLNSSEAQTYSMLTKSKANIGLTLPDPLEPEYNIAVEILPTGKNKIRSAIRDDVPVFSIDVNLECTIEYIQSEIDYTLPQNYDILREHIRKFCSENMMKLIAKTQKEYNADILKLGDKLAYHFSTTGEWERYNWPEKYKDAEITLNVNANIERV